MMLLFQILDMHILISNNVLIVVFMYQSNPPHSDVLDLKKVFNMN